MRGILLALLVSLAAAGSASGQLNGENIKGDVGLKSGSQPPPGTYLTNLIHFFRALKEFGNRTATQGHGVVASFTFFVDRPFRELNKRPPAAPPGAQPAAPPTVAPQAAPVKATLAKF